RARHQYRSRPAARADRAAATPRPRRRGDRIALEFAALHEWGLPYRYTTEESGLILRRHRTNACQSCAIKHRCTTGTTDQMALHVLAYNLTRVMNIMGIQPVMAAIR